MDVVIVRVPAKINLQLAVGAPGADGFHELATVFLAVSCFDEVTVRPSSEISVEVEGEQADLVPRDGTNLALRAARLVAETARVEPRVALRIRKGIPVAGGMAGGECGRCGRFGCMRRFVADKTPRTPAP